MIGIWGVAPPLREKKEPEPEEVGGPVIKQGLFIIQPYSLLEPGGIMTPSYDRYFSLHVEDAPAWEEALKLGCDASVENPDYLGGQKVKLYDYQGVNRRDSKRVELKFDRYVGTMASMSDFTAELIVYESGEMPE